MKFLIAGAGAVGGFLASRLADAGHDVTVLVRPSRAAAIREHGLTIAGPGGISVAWPDVVTAAGLRPGYEAVVVAVKAGTLPGLLGELVPAVTPDTVVVPFLNGMGHVGPLTESFGPAVLGGVLRVVAEADEAGTVRVLRPLFEIELGEFDGSRTGRTEHLAAAFRAAGAQVTVSADITGAMWAKWVYIASIGAVTGLMRAPVGDIVAVAGGARFVRALLDEAAAAAAACGHPVPAGQLAFTAHSLSDPRSPSTSSLSRDLMAGRPTEVEAVLGDFADRARMAGAATPLITLATLALRVHNRRLAGRNGA
jgi:2-dehydropantoate 2-reductase